MSGVTTELALDAVAYERAPRWPGRQVNRRIVCADGFAASIQASEIHYANDSHAMESDDEWPPENAPYWRGGDAAYPFTSFEIGNPTEADLSALDEWESGGIWAWVPRAVVADLLDSHGGAIGWEPER